MAYALGYSENYSIGGTIAVGANQSVSYSGGDPISLIIENDQAFPMRVVIEMMAPSFTLSDAGLYAAMHATRSTLFVVDSTEVSTSLDGRAFSAYASYIDAQFPMATANHVMQIGPGGSAQVLIRDELLIEDDDVSAPASVVIAGADSIAMDGSGGWRAHATGWKLEV